MDSHALVPVLSLAVVGHSTRASDPQLLVDSALGVGAGLLAVAGYLLVLRWRATDDRGAGEGGDSDRRRSAPGDRR